MIKTINISGALRLNDAFFIDARSPKEYEEDHILGAVNVPLLFDMERHEVGLIYKQVSREKAIEKGIEFFPLKIPLIYKAVKGKENRNIVVYCARGGMRSKIIASLIDSLGYKTYQIEGGYKAFRNYMNTEINKLTIRPRIIVLWGLTCTGKTALLHKFKNSLDIEGIAQHRGSLYGALGLKPNSQKKFENLILNRLKELEKEKVIILEGESRRVGNVIIPEALYKGMMHGTHILINRSMEIRCREIVSEYFTNEKIIEEIKNITLSLKRLISNKDKQNIIRDIIEGNYLEACRSLLENYYDPLYRHTLKQLDFAFEIDNDNVDEAVTTLHKILQAIS